MLRTIDRSGLRGRGGAGFPTSLKWELAAKSPGDKKYVVCNADEGEPGTFKDRVILADYADLVFEGMTIAARILGAKQGIMYLRAEYTYLCPHLEAVLEQRRQRNQLGRDIGGESGFDFDIQIAMGSGAYVCGEETALTESLEGQRGEPRNRPPFPIDTGYLGHPTIVNNVETFAWVTCILAKGPEWFKGQGTAKSSGAKLFSVSGDCDRPGVYEFPMGITVTELLLEVGGQNAKAVQIGGAAGQCVPAAQFDRTVAYEDIPTGGSVIVFGPQRDMLDIARQFPGVLHPRIVWTVYAVPRGDAQALRRRRDVAAGKMFDGLRQGALLAGRVDATGVEMRPGPNAPNTFLSIVEHFRDEIFGRTNRVLNGSEKREHEQMSDGSRLNTPSTRAPASQRGRTAEVMQQAKSLAKQITVTIDGHETTVPLGTSVLEAARAGHSHPDALLP